MVNTITEKFVIQQLEAMNCSKFKIGIFDRINNIMNNRDYLEYDNIINMIKYLKFRNLNGCDIYITQATGVNRALILIDDLDLFKIDRLIESDLEPACITETSPNNFQVWISLGEDSMPKEQRKIVARVLAKEFGGDPGSTDANHLGRLAGFTNRKPSHNNNGLYPFVICRSATGRHAKKGIELREWSKYIEENEKKLALEKEKLHQEKILKIGASSRQNGNIFFAKCYDQWLQNKIRYNSVVDLSIGDFTVTCKMLLNGYSEAEIFQAMAENSPNISERKKNHVNDYINRTINAVKIRIYNN
jgi:hypothetical protein